MLAAGLAPLALAPRGPALAQAAAPLRVIVPQPPGGVTDLLARLLQEELARELARAVVVENRPGANGIVAVNALRQSRPDGSAMLLAGVSIFSFNPHIYPNLPYDPWRDFSWIAPVSDMPFVLVAGRRSGITSVEQLVAQARAQPERIAYASAGIGNSTHLAMELIADRAGIRLNHIPFNGSAPALTSVIAGDAAAMVNPLGGTLPQIRAGEVRALATLGAERSGLLPDVPTLREAGLAEVAMPGWFAFVGPAGMEAGMVERLNAATRAAVASPTAAARLQDLVLLPLFASAAEIQARARAASEEMGAFVRRRGIRAE